MQMKKQIKEVFESAADEYQTMIPKIVPYYEEQQKILLDFIPFTKDQEFSVLDLGVGTGNLSRRILGEFPRAKVHGVDIAENMVEMSKKSLKEFAGRFVLECADFSKIELPENKYDVVIGDLSVHHLVHDEKCEMFKRVHHCLKKSGVFLMRELVISADMPTNLVFLHKWDDFMNSNGVDADNVIRNHSEHDFPAAVADQVEWLKEAEFLQAFCPWQYLNFAILVARK